MKQIKKGEGKRRTLFLMTYFWVIKWHKWITKGDNI